jgi:hypothetical protein
MRFLFKIWSAFLTSISIHACIELKKNAEEHTFCHKSQTLNIVVPMAGDDSLFRQAGFLEPKPFISLKGKKMISWVIENILPKRSIENIQKLKFKPFFFHNFSGYLFNYWAEKKIMRHLMTYNFLCYIDCYEKN